MAGRAFSDKSPAPTEVSVCSATATAHPAQGRAARASQGRGRHLSNDARGCARRASSPARALCKCGPHTHLDPASPCAGDHPRGRLKVPVLKPTLAERPVQVGYQARITQGHPSAFRRPSVSGAGHSAPCSVTRAQTSGGNRGTRVRGTPRCQWCRRAGSHDTRCPR